MEAADLTDLLKQGGDFTLFAPSDKAFASLSQSDLAMLRSTSPNSGGSCYLKECKDRCLTLYYASGDINALRTILLYHINKGIFIGGGLEAGVTNLLKSYQGSNIRVVHVSRLSKRQTFIKKKIEVILYCLCYGINVKMGIRINCTILMLLLFIFVYLVFVLNTDICCYCSSPNCIIIIFFLIVLYCIVLYCFFQANNSMLVNTIRVPDSDIMATNGVIHFVDNVLYPGGIISLHSSRRDSACSQHLKK